MPPSASAETAVSGERIVRRNPATLELVGEVPCVDAASVPMAVRKARQAQKDWTASSLDARRERLKKLQVWVAEHQLEIARTVCEETGKPRLEATNVDLMSSLSVGRFAIAEMGTLFRPERIDLGKLDLTIRAMGRGSYLHARPLGVVGLITPWNYPFGLPYSQTMMALAAGNSVIIKPSSEAPMSALWVERACLACGLPEGAVQVLVGKGGTVGKALLASGVDRVVFTGSGEKGREVMAEAAQRLTPVTLELGGKDPFIVLEDADLERTVRGAAWGAFVNAGQTCAGVKRIYVQRRIADGFTEALAMQASRLKMGWGWDDPEVSVGPLISEQALRDVEAAVSLAIGQGARCITGGRRHPTLPGHFYEPTILVGAKQDMDIVQQEVFGPIVTIIPFDSDEEALALAEDCPYALNASVWTRDQERGRRLAERLPGGTAVINNTPYTFGIGETPWGGSKESGFGRTHGHLGFLELVETHHVHWDKGGYAQDIWWSPYDQEKREAGEALVDDLFRKEGGSTLLKMLRHRRLMRR
jgi:succinate-semialdehyde dehydrogenase/glutarate-semialdehyde dehydrogenase